MDQTKLDALFIVLALSLLKEVGLAAGELGQSGYTEYHMGSGASRVILSAPHGGSVKPEDIPDREAGCWSQFDARCVWTHDCGDKDEEHCKVATLQDSYTLELARLLQQELFNLTGAAPHVVINHLHRSKMDANRDVTEATFGVTSATGAWWEYHNFLAKAKAAVGRCGPGLLLDIHGQAHPENWVELGYLLKATVLDSAVTELHRSQSSIRSLAISLRDRLEFSDLLRGPTSFGSILSDYGHKVVPSTEHPGPAGGRYYSGGYITRTYGSVDGGRVDAIQIESPRSLRSPDISPGYAKNLAASVVKFMELHYGYGVANSTTAEDTKEDDKEDVVTDRQSHTDACGNVRTSAENSNSSDSDPIDPSASSGRGAWIFVPAITALVGFTLILSSV